MPEAFTTLHAALRWVILAVGLGGLLWSLGPRRVRAGGGGLDRMVPGLFLGLLDLEGLLGLLLLAGLDEPRGPHLPHGLAMMLAILGGHLLARRARAAEVSRRWAGLALVFALPLALVLLGITVFLERGA